MLIIKLVVAIVLISSTVIQGLLDYKFTDKRTTRFRRLRQAHFAVLIVSAVGIIAITVADSVEIGSLQTEIHQLSANISPRTLTDENRTLLVEHLSDIGSHEILLTSTLGSDEASGLVGEISDVFNLAGWKVLGPGQKAYGEVTDSLVLFASHGASRELLDQIVDAFKAAHLPVTVLQTRGAAIALNTPPSELEIFVGVK